MIEEDEDTEDAFYYTDSSSSDDHSDSESDISRSPSPHVIIYHIPRAKGGILRLDSIDVKNQNLCSQYCKDEEVVLSIIDTFNKDESIDLPEIQSKFLSLSASDQASILNHILYDGQDIGDLQQKIKRTTDDSVLLSGEQFFKTLLLDLIPEDNEKGKKCRERFRSLLLQTGLLARTSSELSGTLSWLKSILGYIIDLDDRYIPYLYDIGEVICLFFNKITQGKSNIQEVNKIFNISDDIKELTQVSKEYELIKSFTNACMIYERTSTLSSVVQSTCFSSEILEHIRGFIEAFEFPLKYNNSIDHIEKVSPRISFPQTVNMPNSSGYPADLSSRSGSKKRKRDTDQPSCSSSSSFYHHPAQLNYPTSSETSAQAQSQNFGNADPNVIPQSSGPAFSKEKKDVDLKVRLLKSIGERLADLLNKSSEASSHDYKESLTNLQFLLRKNSSNLYQQSEFDDKAKRNLSVYLFNILGQHIVDALFGKTVAVNPNYNLISDIILSFDKSETRSNLKEQNYFHTLAGRLQNSNVYGEVKRFVYAVKNEAIAIFVSFISTSSSSARYEKLIKDIGKFSLEKNNPQSSAPAFSKEKKDVDRRVKLLKSIGGRLAGLLSKSREASSHDCEEALKKVRHVFRKNLSNLYQQSEFDDKAKRNLSVCLFNILGEHIVDTILGKTVTLNPNYDLISDIILSFDKSVTLLDLKVQNYFHTLAGRLQKPTVYDEAKRFVYAVKNEAIAIFVSFISTSPSSARYEKLIQDIEKFSLEKNNPQSSGRAFSQEQQSHEGQPSYSSSSSFYHHPAQLNYPTSSETSAQAQSQNFGNADPNVIPHSSMININVAGPSRSYGNLPL
ncbi:hypothetical protein [Wolbachia pipientis]|uniref:hypothetical protein n=1 Tax=Wolbachia pipientis TaxID=955 RepID=UPI0020B6C94D|nr:hypothetical protein [Wolbachia pipientis]